MCVCIYIDIRLMAHHALGDVSFKAGRGHSLKAPPAGHIGLGGGACPTRPFQGGTIGNTPRHSGQDPPKPQTP